MHQNSDNGPIELGFMWFILKLAVTASASSGSFLLGAYHRRVFRRIWGALAEFSGEVSISANYYISTYKII